MSPAADAVRRVGAVVAIVLIGGAAASQASEALRHVETTSLALPAQLKLLVVESNDGDLVLEPAEGTLPQASGHARWSWQRPVIERSTSSNEQEARIVATCPGGGPFQSCSVDWRVTVPEGTAVVLTSGSGDIRARSLRGSVRATTTSGDIVLDGVSAPDVALRSSTGDIDVRNSTVPKVTAESTTGDIDIASRLPLQTLDATTTTGDLSVLLPRDSTTYNITDRTRTGTRRVEVPDEAASTRQLRLESTTGDLSVNYGGSRR